MLNSFWPHLQIRRYYIYPTFRNSFIHIARNRKYSDLTERSEIFGIMDIRPFVNNVVKTLFRSTKRLSSLAILHIYGPTKDVDVDRVSTWWSMPPYLRMTVCEYVMRLKSI